MKSNKTRILLCALFFAALAALTFRSAWPADRVFSASDLNIGRLAFIRQNLPELFIGYYRPTELLGFTGYGVSLFNVLLAMFPLTFFANVFYGAVLAASSLALVWFLRLWNRSWTASVFGALVAFWFNSVMLASGGHAYKMEVLAFSVLALGLIEKAVRASRPGRAAGWSLLAGLAIGVTMVEQQDVALLGGLFTGAYALFRLVQVHGRAPLRWLALLAPIGTVALLLAGGTMARSYRQNIAEASSIQGDPQEKWDFVTQWSMVPSEWPELVAPGWSGWSSNHPEAPYWGALGQSAEWPETGRGFRNFKLTSNYFGIVPFLLGAFGLACALRARKSEVGKAMLFWSVAGLLGLALAFGKYSLPYRLFYHLPLVGNIRGPIKLLDNFQICLGIVAAYGLDRLLAGGKAAKPAKALWVAGAAGAVAMLLAGLALLAFPAGRMAGFAAAGFEPHAGALVRRMAIAWLHGGALALAGAGLAFAAWKGARAARWAPILFIALLAADSLLLTSRYFSATDISALKQGNVVVNHIKEHQGGERTIFLDPGGIYNQWLASDGPYHGLNLFNIWQMPRMPGDYKAFLETVGRNQIRLWELSAVKFVAAPAPVMQQLAQNPEIGRLFQPVLRYQVPTAQGMREDVLLEFKGAIPRMALFHGWDSVPAGEQCSALASPQHDSRSIVLLDPAANLGRQVPFGPFRPLEARTTKRKATVRVNASTDAIVRFSQYYQPGWTVRVNGKPAGLLRVDYLCMGVAVPPGEHVVEFRCIDGTFQAAFMLGVFLLSAAAAAWLLRPGKNHEA